jgi:hypothetical protein
MRIQPDDQPSSGFFFMAQIAVHAPRFCYNGAIKIDVYGGGDAESV